MLTVLEDIHRRIAGETGLTVGLFPMQTEAAFLHIFPHFTDN